jgi:hypothetical protein
MSMCVGLWEWRIVARLSAIALHGHREREGGRKGQRQKQIRPRPMVVSSIPLLCFKQSLKDDIRGRGEPIQCLLARVGDALRSPENSC